jgi:hypothetical protein
MSSVDRFCCRSRRRQQRGSGEDKAVDAVVRHLLHRKRIIASDALGYAGARQKSARRSAASRWAVAREQRNGHIAAQLKSVMNYCL